MSIPEVSATGIEDVDDQLALMLKWKWNECPQVGMFHELLACVEMIMLASEGRLSKEAIDGYLKFSKEHGVMSEQ